MARKKLLHLKSGVVTQVGDNTVPKLPTSQQIELGEIAINYAEGYETLAIKNSASGIVTFSNDQILIDYVDNAISGAVSGINEVTIYYSGGTEPTSADTYEIYIDDTVEPAEVDVYTQKQVDELVSASCDSVREIVRYTDSGTSATTNSAILIDETIEEKTVDIYTQDEMDTILSEAIKVGDSSGSTSGSAVWIDTSTDVEVEFYTKAQVDGMYQTLLARIEALEAVVFPTNNNNNEG